MINPNRRLERHLLEGEKIKELRCLCLDEVEGRLYVGHGGRLSCGGRINVYRYVTQHTTDRVTELTMKVKLAGLEETDMEKTAL